MSALDQHIQKVTEEIKKKTDYIVNTENLPVETLLSTQKKLAELGQLWQWLNYCKQGVEGVKPENKLVSLK